MPLISLVTWWSDLLRSLDESFKHLVLMIKERTDFRTLVPTNILERLTTYELEQDEKRDVNGSRRRPHALKAKASHHSSQEVSSASGYRWSLKESSREQRKVLTTK